MKNKIFVITGELSFPRSEFREMISKAGGIVETELGDNTDFLIAGDKSGSKLIAARHRGIKTISEYQALQMITQASVGFRACRWEVVEVTAKNGNPAWAIMNVDRDGKPFRALRNIVDGTPLWVSRLEWGWHTFDRTEAEKVLEEITT